MAAVQIAQGGDLAAGDVEAVEDGLGVAEQGETFFGEPRVGFAVGEGGAEFVFEHGDLA
nr:hypothetical protein [Amycolatopsis sp. FDAARGOS 1241]